MNGQTAKLLRKHSHLTGYPYKGRDGLKEMYKDLPQGDKRFKFKEAIRAENERVKKIKNRHPQKQPVTQEQSEFQKAKEAVTPGHNHSHPATTTPNQSPEPTWWQGFWEWLKSKLQPIFSIQ